jgi:hypothetical protein
MKVRGFRRLKGFPVLAFDVLSPVRESIPENLLHLPKYFLSLNSQALVY